MSHRGSASFYFAPLEPRCLIPVLALPGGKEKGTQVCVTHITRMSAQTRVPTCWTGPVDPDCNGLSDVFPWMDDQTSRYEAKEIGVEARQRPYFCCPCSFCWHCSWGTDWALSGGVSRHPGVLSLASWMLGGQDHAFCWWPCGRSSGGFGASSFLGGPVLLWEAFLKAQPKVFSTFLLVVL